jgi:hypothetical protein
LDLTTSLNLAAAKHLGNVCFSDDPQKLPVYWLDEIAQIQQLNATITGDMKVVKPATKKKQAVKKKPR